MYGPTNPDHLGDTVTDSNSNNPARRSLFSALTVAAATGACLTSDPTTARFIDDLALQQAEADTAVHATESDDEPSAKPQQNVQ